MNTMRFLAACSLALMLTASAAAHTGARITTVTVTLKPFAAEYHGYAQVKPRSVLVLKAAATGEIAKLAVSPGQHVHAGETVATLVGTDYQTELSTARAQFRAAQMTLRIVRHNYPVFSSAQDVTNARTALQEARATLARTRAAGQIRAPFGGIVLSVNVSPGERVSAGTSLLNLLPDHNLWLRATLFVPGAVRVRPGMTGEFHPTEGGADIQVRVSAVIPPLTAGGGVIIACTTTVDTAWQDGEAGSVSIASGAAQPMPVVPTAALVMDQGKWWVLLANARGLQRQPVEIGLSDGSWTYISRGLHAGERVVAVDAYLLFHANISQHYAPPD